MHISDHMFGINGRKRREKKCNSILSNIITTNEVLGVYCKRIKDSIMQNEGNIMNVYQEISFTISKDYDEPDRDVCDRVSVTLVTMIRMSANNYKDLEYKYHG